MLVCRERILLDLAKRNALPDEPQVKIHVRTNGKLPGARADKEMTQYRNYTCMGNAIGGRKHEMFSPNGVLWNLF